MFKGNYLEDGIRVTIWKLIFAILLLTGVAGAQLSIDSCQPINSAGEYVLTVDIIDHNGSCIIISSSDVIFDGNGHTIDGQNLSGTFGVDVSCFECLSHTNVTVKNLKVSDWEKGIYYLNINNGNIINNTAYSNLEGIELSSSSNNTLIDNTVSSNNEGIYLYSSINNLLKNNNVSANSENGISLQYSSNNNTINDNIVNSNSNAGIDLSSSNNNTLARNTANLNKLGLFLSLSIEDNDLSKDNTLINNIAKNNALWDFYSDLDSINNTVINLDINKMISFTGKDIAIRPASTPPIDPPNLYNISKFINATNTSIDSWLFLNVSYSDSNITGLNESSLRWWKNDGSSWSKVTGTNGVDMVQKNVFANITSFSIFAPLGVEGVPPASIKDLKNISISHSSILWTWINPDDPDFASVIVFINGVFKENILNKSLYAAVELDQDTNYTISTRTVDINGNINQTWVNDTAKTSVKPEPIFINITSPENNTLNKTGSVNFTILLDREGTNASLNWKGVNETMNGEGRNFWKNETGILSGIFTFKVYASSKTNGVPNVSETRIITVDRTTITNLSEFIDPVTDNFTREVHIIGPVNTTMITFLNSTHISYLDSSGNSIKCEPIKKFSKNPLDKIPDYAEIVTFGSDKFAGINITAGPICDNIQDVRMNIIPDATIQFNYSQDILDALGIKENDLKVKFFNNETSQWQYIDGELNISANTLTVPVNHFSLYVLAGAAALSRISASGGSSSDGGGVGGGELTKEPPENIEKFETKYNTLKTDTSVNYQFTPLPQYGIYEIVVTSNKTEFMVPIRTEILKGLSRLINEPAPEIVHYYTNVWAGTNDIKDVLIRFKEENSWMTSQNLNGMKMLKWDGNNWVDLDTKEIKKDNTYTYFEASSKGLSQLAVVGVIAPTSPATTGIVTTPQPVVSGIEPKTTATPGSRALIFNLNSILIVFAIILGAIILITGIAGSTPRTTSTEQLIGKTPEEYGEKYREHLIKQYKMYVDTADRVSQRGQSVNNYFLIFNSIFITLFGVLSGVGSIAKQNMWQFLLLLSGLLVSITWATTMNSYIKLNYAKLNVIQKVESLLPASLFESESKIIGDVKQYLTIRHMERFVPWFFVGLYIILIIITLWNLPN
jgi:PGF-pre-PGF domain-containing protein